MANEHLFEPVMTPYVSHDEHGRQVTAERLELPHRALVAKSILGHFPQLHGDQDTIEDLVQTTYMKAWEHRDQYNHKAKFSTWLYRIAINATIDYMRKEDKYREVVVPMDEEALYEISERGDLDLRNTDYDDDFMQHGAGVSNVAEQMEDPDGDPLAWLEAEEALTAASAIVSTLSITLRETFIMREVQDMSYDDIAATLGVPVGTVRSRLNEARRLVREEVSRRGEYWPAVVSNYLG